MGTPKQKFTPGPWSTPHMAQDSVNCNCAYVLSEGYAGSICTINVGDGKTVSNGGNDCPPLEEAKANARLIAQAPEMYRLIDKAAKVFRECAIDTGGTSTAKYFDDLACEFEGAIAAVERK